MLLTACQDTAMGKPLPNSLDDTRTRMSPSPSVTHSPVLTRTTSATPSVMPSPAVKHVVTILHTNDVFGQMDPCG
jgi:hypothetical protein